MTINVKAPNRYWGAATPPQSKRDFFNAVTSPPAADGSTVATIRMYGPIDSWGGWWGISAKDMGEVLDALPDTVDRIILRINSPGGEVFEAMTILNMLRAHKANVTAVVDALAASAASFIAAGCDDTVMSPGTQMMIHSPLVFTYGNAEELRKDAQILDGIQDSIIEIYAAKAGEKAAATDWAQLLADETWYTAEKAVTQGLADRVATIPNAGETQTVGADDEDEDDDLVIVTVPVEDATPTRPMLFAARTAATMPPVSTEPGTPNRKETLDMSDTPLADIRERLGIPADSTDEQLLAAVEELSVRAAVTTPPSIPAGTQLIDSTVLEQIQNQASQGAQALATQTEERRTRVLDQALAEGRITAASRATWAALLETNETGTTEALNSLPKNTALPVVELGFSDTVNSADDALYAKAWGNDDTKEA
ncbi:head maturation protease, ClpP-related [Microbacterium dauci]|uniref:ATP-dependent Clp protease proteolytic subunit n=1 Tax=Microbacterium dauci TaxID=3048008 RepID=A0ABT6ZAP0_9MICO|nr:head maturation protease, ClpP-related [Microbacterium sp. LX3-4]MDJ1113229.1 ATP-dependent Clp protease proteolytic subunit [Microbacterium sp. LX3-4]